MNSLLTPAHVARIFSRHFHEYGVDSVVVSAHVSLADDGVAVLLEKGCNSQKFTVLTPDLALSEFALVARYGRQLHEARETLPRLPGWRNPTADAVSG